MSVPGTIRYRVESRERIEKVSTLLLTWRSLLRGLPGNVCPRYYESRVEKELRIEKVSTLYLRSLSKSGSLFADSGLIKQQHANPSLQTQTQSSSSKLLT